jgi:hypothetical protein
MRCSGTGVVETTGAGRHGQCLLAVLRCAVQDDACCRAARAAFPPHPEHGNNNSDGGHLFFSLLVLHLVCFSSPGHLECVSPGIHSRCMPFFTETFVIRDVLCM